jgi:outer membrane protein OmpA-like peptidoglycan-associated protein
MMSWMEYGVTYGREIFQINDHYLKGAVTLKLLQGLGAAYLYVDELDYNFTNDDTLSLFNSDVKYGHSTNFEFDTENFKYQFISDPTVGLDFGLVYEWRKDKEKYTYDMDGQTGLYRKDKNKYKLKVGVSVLDIGRVRYQKGDVSANFLANIDDYYIGDFEIGSVEDFNDTLDKNFDFTQDAGDYFRMKLPTSMSLQVDYNIWRGFYANFTAFGSFRRQGQESKLRNQSMFSIAPRFEHKWFDFAVPVIFNTDGMFMLGSSMRLGVLFFGTNNVLAFAQNDVYGADFYMGLKVPIPYGKPKDRDNDKVSNKKDKCPKTAGTWEFAGCPDTDGDGIPDDQDECPKEFGQKDKKGCPYPDPDGDGIVGADDDCPNEFGPAENNGCPWGDKDGDGLTDNVDLCPDVAGPRENNGCPWGDRDKDGVLDNVDRCPDEAGPAENGGCPWGDMDGDGVPDNVDECPRTPGPADNNGCPVLEREQAEVIKRAFDNLEFETGKAVIKQSSYVTLTELAKLLIDNQTYSLIIAGHTDDVGSDSSNMKLSKERAEAVAKALTERGVKPDQLIVEYYGETKPIATNATAEGRAQNRRVERTIRFQ